MIKLWAECNILKSVNWFYLLKTIYNRTELNLKIVLPFDSANSLTGIFFYKSFLEVGEYRYTDDHSIFFVRSEKLGQNCVLKGE